MSRINRVPKGFQYFLGSTYFGDNPSALADKTQPVIDMLPFYGAEILDYAYNAGVLDAINQTVSIEVPEGELWLIQSVSTELNFDAAGDTCNIGLELFEVLRQGAIAPGIPYFLGNTGVITSIQIGEQFTYAYTPAHLIPLPASSRVQANVNQMTTATFVAVSVQVQYYRLLV